MSAGLGGIREHSVDDKGRIVIPVSFKKYLGLEFVITAGYDNNLMMMSYSQWDKFVKQFDKYPAVKVRRIKRYFMGNMSEVSIDKQNRMQIPQALRQKLGIEDSVVLVGNDDNAEIWTPEAWQAESEGFMDSKQISDSLMELADEQ